MQSSNRVHIHHVASLPVFSKCLNLEGRLLFLGDSVSDQLRYALILRLHSYGIDLNCYSFDRLFEECFSIQNGTSASTFVATNTLTICFRKMGSAGSHRRWFGRTGETGLTHSSPLCFAGHVLASEGQSLLNGDVLIINEGVHFRGVRSDAELYRIQQCISTIPWNHTASGVHLLWRETLAQHFNTPSGVFDLKVFSHRKRQSSPCVPLADPTFVLRRNANVSNVMTRHSSPAKEVLNLTPVFFPTYLWRGNL